VGRAGRSRFSRFALRALPIVVIFWIGWLVYRAVVELPQKRIDYVGLLRTGMDGGSATGPNAVDLYLEAFESLPEECRAADATAVLAGGWDQVRNLPDVRALEKCDAALERFERAAAMQRCNFLAGASSMREFAIGMPFLPHLSSFRQFARIEAARMRMAFEAGDDEAVLRRFKGLVGAAMHLCRQPSLIMELTGVAILDLGLSEVRLELLERPYRPGMLAEMQQALSGPDSALEILSMALRGEESLWLEMIQTSYTDDGSGDGRLDLDAFKTWAIQTVGRRAEFSAKGRVINAAGYLLPSRAKVRALVNRHLEVLRRLSAVQPYAWQRANASDECRRLAEIPWLYRYLPPTFLFAMSAPSLAKAPDIAWRSICDVRATRVMLALERYRQGRGEYPAELDGLVPKWLPAVPRDPFSGEPFKYRREGLKYVLYSVGPDRADNGGRFPVDDGESCGWTTDEGFDVVYTAERRTPLKVYLSRQGLAAQPASQPASRPGENQSERIPDDPG